MAKGSFPAGQWLPKAATLDKTGKLRLPKSPVRVKTLHLGPRG